MPAVTLHPRLLEWLRSPPLSLSAFPPLRDATEWPAIARDADRHGFVPLLYANLAPGCEMPAALRASWRDQAARVAARNLWLSAELGQILDALRARDLACVPMRGTTLAEQLYGHLALRPTGDIDLLVQRADLDALRAALIERGYAEVEARRGFAEAFDYTLTFFRDGGRLIVEPHWTIAYPPFAERFDMAPVWARCVAGSTVGAAALRLGAEDQLLHLALHLIHHRDVAPLLWHYELHRWISTRTIRWELVCQTAAEGRVGLLASFALREVQSLFKTPMPAAALDALARARLSRSERALIALLTTPRRVQGRERLAGCLSARGIAAKMRYALAFLCPSRAFIRQQYGVTTPWQIAHTYVTRACEYVWRSVVALVAVSRRGERAQGRRGG